MSKAEELAELSDRLADEGALIHLQSWELLNRTLRMNAVELRRLAQVEVEHAALLKAISDAEPVAHLWQHGETGRTRIVMPDQIVTADANWSVVGPLYTLNGIKP